MPPLEQRENNTDHFFIPQELRMLSTRAQLDTLKLRDSAISAINEYYKFLHDRGILGHMAINDFISNCLSLVAVKNYTHFAFNMDGREYSNSDNTLDEGIARCIEKTHERNVRTHISLKIKEYIDGKH